MNRIEARVPVLGLLALTFLTLCTRTTPLFAQPPALPAPTGSPGAPPGMSPEANKAAIQFQKALQFQKARKVGDALNAYKEFLRLADAAKLNQNVKLPAYLNMAILYQAQGNAFGYEQTLQNILKIDSKNVLANAQYATLAAKAGRLDEAKKAAERALAGRPTPTEAAPAHFALGAVAFAQNNLVLAEKEFGEAARLAPNNAQAQYNYAVALARNQKYKLALAPAQKARTLDPKLDGAYTMVAVLRQQAGDTKGALAAYEDILKREPRSPLGIFGKAGMLAQLGQTDRAISTYLHGLELYPENFLAQLATAQLYYGIGNFSAAKDRYAAAAKRNAKDARAFTGLGLSAMQDGARLLDKRLQDKRYAESEKAFKQSLALAPKDEIVQDSLAGLYEKMGRYDDAIALYRRRLSTRPEDVQVYRRIAATYMMQKDGPKAIETWKAYRFLKPYDPVSYEEVGHVLELMGKREDAIVEYQALLEKQPKNGNARLAIARNYMQRKKYSEAEKEFKAVLTLDITASEVPAAQRNFARSTAEANHIEALQGLAEIARNDKKWDDAVTWWTRVKEVQTGQSKRTGAPADPETYRGLATAYERAGKIEKAIKEFQNLADLLPNEGGPYLELAMLYDRQDRIAPAIASYQIAAQKQKDPTDTLLQIPNLYRKRGKLDEAITEYVSLQDRLGKEPRYLSELAQTYEQAGRDAKALATYEALEKADAQATWVAGRRATLLMRLKRFEEARTLYVKLIDKNPDVLQNYADLYQVYHGENKLDAYAAWLKARLEKTPARRSLMGYIVSLEAERKQEAEGWKFVRSVYEKNAEVRPVAESYAVLLTERGKLDEALTVYRKIAADNPKDPKARTDVVEHLDFMQRPDEATKELESLAADNEFPAGQKMLLKRRLADRYLQRKQYAKAIPLYEDILKVLRDDYVATTSLAAAYTETNRPAEAINLYAGLLKQPGFPPEILAQFRSKMGSLYEKQGNMTEAIGQYKEALKLNPQDTIASSSLKRLEGK